MLGKGKVGNYGGQAKLGEPSVDRCHRPVSLGQDSGEARQARGVDVEHNCTREGHGMHKRPLTETPHAEGR